MNNLEALMAECEPFTISKRTIEKALTDNGLVPDSEYSSKSAIAKTAVEVLSRFLSLRSESEGSFSQGFDKEGLKARIKALAEIAGIDASSYISQVTISDGSKLW
ncbi:MAG: hypothetical protein Q8R90_08670 [Bacteroidales bacterium]|nr:hypothetical protein [Bacteroidales bacterium]